MEIGTQNELGSDHGTVDIGVVRIQPNSLEQIENKVSCLYQVKQQCLLKFVHQIQLTLKKV